MQTLPLWPPPTGRQHVVAPADTPLPSLSSCERSTSQDAEDRTAASACPPAPLLLSWSHCCSKALLEIRTRAWLFLSKDRSERYDDVSTHRVEWERSARAVRGADRFFPHRQPLRSARGHTQLGQQVHPERVPCSNRAKAPRNHGAELCCRHKRWRCAVASVTQPVLEQDRLLDRLGDAVDCLFRTRTFQICMIK